MLKQSPERIQRKTLVVYRESLWKKISSREVLLQLLRSREKSLPKSWEELWNQEQRSGILKGIPKSFSNELCDQIWKNLWMESGTHTFRQTFDNFERNRFLNKSLNEFLIPERAFEITSFLNSLLVFIVIGWIIGIAGITGVSRIY